MADISAFGSDVATKYKKALTAKRLAKIDMTAEVKGEIIAIQYRNGSTFAKQRGCLCPVPRSVSIGQNLEKPCDGCCSREKIIQYCFLTCCIVVLFR